MTKDEALQMCLEYIETNAHERKYVRHAIKEALAQPEQEPVAKYSDVISDGGLDPRNTTPPKREWVKLTEEQFLEAARLAEDGNYLVAFQRIQQWLKEKNT